ncbi:MAG: 3-hydroxyacyl-ACP dehydratase FabZ [Alphaproteobacteria bacterium]|nr:3-hydroxyacyl-ACP dehydratase FabZ [Alphaproteobacteria bacterium]
MTADFTINTSLPQYDTEGIKSLIPHRDPMLMIDSIANIVEGQSIVGIKNVTGKEDFFRGHFPNHPVMPGVLIVEAMAQSAAALVVHTMGQEARGKVVYFMSVEEAKFRKPVVPGDMLYMHCQVERSRGAVWKFSGIATVNGQKVAESTFSAMIMDKQGS